MANSQNHSSLRFSSSSTQSPRTGGSSGSAFQEDFGYSRNAINSYLRQARNYYTKLTSNQDSNNTENAYTSLPLEGLAINNIKTGNLFGKLLIYAASRHSSEWTLRIRHAFALRHAPFLFQGSPDLT